MGSMKAGQALSYRALPCPALHCDALPRMSCMAGTNSHFGQGGGGGGLPCHGKPPPSPFQAHGMGRVPPRLQNYNIGNCANPLSRICPSPPHLRRSEPDAPSWWLPAACCTHHSSVLRQCEARMPTIESRTKKWTPNPLIRTRNIPCALNPFYKPQTAA